MRDDASRYIGDLEFKLDRIASFIWARTESIAPACTENHLLQKRVSFNPFAVVDTQVMHGASFCHAWIAWRAICDQKNGLQTGGTWRDVLQGSTLLQLAIIRSHVQERISQRSIKCLSKYKRTS